MNTKNDSKVDITLLSWYWFLTASDMGPIASANPIRKKARKIGSVRMRWSFFNLVFDSSGGALYEAPCSMYSK